MADDEQQITPEQANEMAQAGAQAAATSPPGQTEQNVRERLHEKRAELNIKIPDEELDRMAKAVSLAVVDDLDHRGAFDSPPEPVQPPDQRNAAPAPGEEATANQPQESMPPQKRTFAHRFMGIG
jgi:hypothetical protein